MEIDFQTSAHVLAMEKVAEQHILTKCSKSKTFQVISDLISIQNLKIVFAQLCNEIQVCNFTML